MTGPEYHTYQMKWYIKNCKECDLSNILSESEIVTVLYSFISSELKHSSWKEELGF